MGGAFEESQRILRQVVFGVGDRQAGRLQKSEQERRDGGPGEPASAERGTVELTRRATASVAVARIAADQRLPYSTLLSSEEVESVRSISGRVFCCTATVITNTAIAPRTAPATALATPGTANFIAALQYIDAGTFWANLAGRRAITYVQATDSRME